MKEAVEIDGSQGEGGGQVLRNALALSLWTQTPLRIQRIRAGRNKPGLLRQHLTAVRAAQEISGAQVEGAELGSQALSFVPGPVRAGDYVFKIGSAGSCMLVLQTVLLPLLRADGPSTVTVEGGTHNPLAPPFEFLEKTWQPQLRRMGVFMELTLERPGFYPAGGGRVQARVHPLQAWMPLALLDRGPVTRITPRVQICDLPIEIARRELEVLGQRLKLPGPLPPPEVLPGGYGPGNVVMVEMESDLVTEVVATFGETRLRAEVVAARAAGLARRYLLSPAPVGEYLADQLLLPMALAGMGSFHTLPLSSHAKTAIEVIHRFLPGRIRVFEEARTHVRVDFDEPVTFVPA